MKKRLLTGGLLIILSLLLAGCGMQQSLESSWGAALPDGGVTVFDLRESDSVYGVRYHVYEYENVSSLPGWCLWDEKTETAEGMPCAAAAEKLLAKVSVREEYLTDFAACLVWYKDMDGSELFVFWPDGGKRVYVLENFTS